MKSLEKFGAVSREFQDLADFISIYISEAHPYDSGDLAETYEWKIKTHQEFEERIEAAKALETACKDINITSPLLVDFMDDRCNQTYGAAPERLYIILNGKIVYMGGCGPFGYKLEEVEEWLKNHHLN